jgi:cysteine sulfinate desulfinase/cysteine desulfurase-like protein
LSSSHIIISILISFLHREQVGQLINSRDPQKDIYFTSCGTESDNRAVDIAINHFKQWKAKRTKDSSNSQQLSSQQQSSSSTVSPSSAASSSDNNQIVPHIITCIIEHPAVICYLRVLREQGSITMTVLQVRIYLSISRSNYLL